MLYVISVSLWRSFVPYVVSFVVVQGARLGFELDNATVNGALVIMGGSAYQGLMRWLEEDKSARWGWLLGWATPPQYATSPKRVAALEDSARGDGGGSDGGGGLNS